MEVAKSEELHRIYDRDGRLEPALVVREAADPKNPLHDSFEWDDSLAAAEHRLQQARQLIRIAVTVLPSVNCRPVRAFISLSSERGAGAGYLKVQQILSDEELRAQALADAITAFNSMQTRFGYLRELTPIWQTLAEISSDLESGKIAAE